MANFYADNHPKFFPLDGHSITWPRGARQAQPGDAVPQMNKATDLPGHRVESIIFGNNYFNWLLAEMNLLLSAPTDGIFWVHGWFFDFYAYKTIMHFEGKQDLPDEFDGAETTDAWTLYREGKALKMGRSKTAFVAKLLELEAAGVDVRIIGNSAPLLMRSRAMLKASNGLGGTVYVGPNNEEHDTPDGVQDRLYATFYNLLRLRGEMTDERRVIFNVLNHPLGGAHSKMVIIGNANYRKAWSGGIDIASDRNEALNHDVAVCVEGKAATMAAKFFVDLWNEISAKPQVAIQFSATHVDTGAVEVPSARHLTHLNSPMSVTVTDITPAINQQDPADKYVQMYRTLPRKHYHASTPKLLGMAVGAKLAGKTGIGILDGKKLVTALRGLDYFYTPALNLARNGCFEFKTVCYKAVDAAEQFILILDQEASNFELMTRINQRVRKLRDQGQILLVIIGTPYKTRGRANRSSQFYLPTTASKQHELFKRLSESIPTREHGQHFLFAHVITHAKVMIVDDIWASIGSANCMRRSFYTDIEMGFSILHETWVRQFRKELYDSLMSTSAPAASDDWYKDFAAWSTTWALDFPTVDFSNYVPHASLLRDAETPPPGTLDEPFDKTMNAYEDPDSNTQI